MVNLMFETAFALLSIAFCFRKGDAWVVAPPSSLSSSTTGNRIIVPAPRNDRGPSSSTTTSTALLAGFGGGSSAQKKELKLKPKQQWDRYTALLKKEKSYKVAVKPVDGGDDDDWLEVGAVKSQGSDKTEFAVARQRALIAEHAKRLYPLKISPKVAVEWAYAAADGEGWTSVDKSVLTDAPDGIEKMIGFEGKPDPSTGFYCYYNEGRLVSSDADLRPSSKKLE